MVERGKYCCTTKSK